MKLLVVLAVICAFALAVNAMPHHGEAGHDGEHGGAGGHGGDGGHGQDGQGGHGHDSQGGHGGQGGHDGHGGHDGQEDHTTAIGIPVSIVRDEDAKYAAAAEVPDIFLHVPIKN